MQLKALFFDVFGTCVDWRNSIAREAAEFGSMHGIRNVDWFRFSDAWRGLYEPQMERVRSGERAWSKLDTLHLESLKIVLERFRIFDVGNEALDNLNRAWHRLDPWPDVVEGLTRLKTQYIVAPNSNGNISLIVNMAKRAGLPWDVILGAETARAYKPTPEAYLRNVELLGLAPEEVMMVAAHNGDLAAARVCDLRTCFVLRPQEHGPEQTSDLMAARNYDIEVRDFCDLAMRLDC
ncbi:haloacid dehalogenase type II [Aminobacter sp. MDW-2]|nr:haloacid dehalogenase type II [Aminobacter sp. MDW-2]MRX37387.1 haloacid dehalogenase type II [Aminobacter sp. MDW-2]QNH37875.1 haloacid dehalogenase type II [Aminobacter sp. MDW-2]